MKQSFVTCSLVALFVAASAVLRAGEDQPATGAASDEKAIREVVDKYFRGVCKADRALLEEAWDVKSGHMKYLHTDGPRGSELKVVPITSALEWWTRVKAQTSSGKVLSVDVVDAQMAFVKFDFHYDEMHYIDYLTLYKLPVGWKIVNKTFVRLTPADQSKEPEKTPELDDKKAAPGEGAISAPTGHPPEKKD